MIQRNTVHLNFPSIQRLHLMYFEVASLLVSSGAQVQPKILEYLIHTNLQTIFPFSIPILSFIYKINEQTFKI